MNAEFNYWLDRLMQSVSALPDADQKLAADLLRDKAAEIRRQAVRREMERWFAGEP